VLSEREPLAMLSERAALARFARSSRGDGGVTICGARKETDDGTPDAPGAPEKRPNSPSGMSALISGASAEKPDENPASGAIDDEIDEEPSDPLSRPGEPESAKAARDCGANRGGSPRAIAPAFWMACIDCATTAAAEYDDCETSGEYIAAAAFEEPSKRAKDGATYSSAGRLLASARTLPESPE
jgi:hypothetical protein